MDACAVLDHSELGISEWVASSVDLRETEGCQRGRVLDDDLAVSVLRCHSHRLRLRIQPVALWRSGLSHSVGSELQASDAGDSCGVSHNRPDNLTIVVLDVKTSTSQSLTSSGVDLGDRDATVLLEVVHRHINSALEVTSGSVVSSPEGLRPVTLDRVPVWSLRLNSGVGLPLVQN